MFRFHSLAAKEMKGVPLRIELGPQDISKGKGSKISLRWRVARVFKVFSFDDDDDDDGDDIVSLFIIDDILTFFTGKPYE